MASVSRIPGITYTIRILIAVLIGLSFSACSILPIPVSDQTFTPTPNPTLVAISRMLTQTRAVPTSTRTPTPTPTRAVTPSLTIEIPLTGDRKLPAAAGKRFDAKNGAAVTILSAQQVESLGRLKAQEGKAYLDLEVLLENNARQAIPYNPLDFNLMTADSSLLQPAVDALPPVMLSGELLPGEWVRGHIAFPIDEVQQGGMVRYKPVLGNIRSEKGTWFELKDIQSQPTAPTIPGKSSWPGKEYPSAGKRQEEGGTALTIEKYGVSSRLPIRKAEKGKRFVTLTVKIENTEHTRAPYNPLYFRAKDIEGYEYLPIIGAPETSLQAGSLGRGQSIRNIVIFEVPETIEQMVVTYLPTVLIEEYAPIRSVLNLGQ